MVQGRADWGECEALRLVDWLDEIWGCRALKDYFPLFCLGEGVYKYCGSGFFCSKRVQLCDYCYEYEEFGLVYFDLAVHYGVFGAGEMDCWIERRVYILRMSYPRNRYGT